MPALAIRSPHVSRSIPVCQWPLWSRLIAKRYDRTRCTAVLDYPFTCVSKADRMPPIERQLYGTLICKIFQGH
jgi:hypothetical protein